MKELVFNVGEEFDGERILLFLKRGAALSSSLIKTAKYGGVFINDENVHMRATVRTGDTVRVVIEDGTGSDILPIEMPLDIIYEDEHLIAVNKPQNMPTHPSRGNHLPTLAQGLAHYFGGKEFVFRAVNRLDRDTSGIVIVAKNRFASARLCESMKRGEFLKRYTAMLAGTPDMREGIIDAPIARECEGNIKRVVREDGKRAITEYRVTEVLPDGRSLCELTLHTGRTHQIRVHMAYIGNPLYNDFLYGERVADGSYYLHAGYIRFPHPADGHILELRCGADFGSDKNNDGLIHSGKK